MKLTTLSSAFCLSLFGLLHQAHADTVVLQDNFDSKTAEEGTPLDSQKVGASQTMWEATSNALIVKGAGIRASDDNPMVCRVPVPADAKEITVEADLKPDLKGKGWMAVGMGSGAPANPNFGGLFLLVFPNGGYSLMFNPLPDDTRSASVVTFKSGRIQSWNPDGMNTLKLVYNRETGMVSAFANGTEELVKGVSLTEKKLTLKAEFAGVSAIFQTSEGRSVGKFIATITK